MRIHLAKILLIASMIISFSGCATTHFSSCKTPDVPYPDINNSHCDTNECVFEKVLTNYEKMKAYAQELYNANQVCK